MKMAHKSFGKKVELPEGTEPITFDVGDEKDIACRPFVNGARLIALVGKVDSGDVTKQSEGILEVFGICVRNDDGDEPELWTGKPFDPAKPFENHSEAELFELANPESDEDDEDEDSDEELVIVQPGVDPTSSLGRLTETLHSPETEISVEELAEMVGWLVEQYTARPNSNAAASGRGGRNTRATSRRKQRRAAGTGAALTSVPPST